MGGVEPGEGAGQLVHVDPAYPGVGTKVALMGVGSFQKMPSPQEALVEGEGPAGGKKGPASRVAPGP